MVSKRKCWILAQPPRRNRAFTLIELLLVLAIMGVLVAVTLPSLSKSIKGNRIRLAARAVITSSRYAHNMAILREEPLLLVFDLDKSAVYVLRSANVSNQPNSTNKIETSRMNGTSTKTNTIFFAKQGFSGANSFYKPLDGVSIESVKVNDNLTTTKGLVSIRFESNGRSAPYTVILEDKYSKRILIDVDALAGTETEDL